MDGHRVVRLSEVVKTVDVVITCTGMITINHKNNNNTHHHNN